MQKFLTLSFCVFIWFAIRFILNAGVDEKTFIYIIFGLFLGCFVDVEIKKRDEK